MAPPNPEAVDRLKAKIAEWTDRLESKDVHSIRRQIGAMLWRSALYRSINESRRLLQAGNGALHGLVNDGYVALHAAAVRRLIDDGPYEGTRGVNSLAGLIKDVRGQAQLLTRQNVIAARGVPYDYEPIQAKALDEARTRAEAAGEQAYHVSMAGWWDSEYWHETWDELCCTTADNRNPEDRPDDAGFQRLLDGLEADAKAVGEYVNKHIAHAATEESRATLATDQRSVSLDKLWHAERAIVRVARFVSRCFGDGAELGGVPTPQFDVFEHMDRPFAASGAKRVMEEAWEQHSAEISRCRDWEWMPPPGSET